MCSYYLVVVIITTDFLNYQSIEYLKLLLRHYLDITTTILMPLCSWGQKVKGQGHSMTKVPEGRVIQSLMLCVKFVFFCFVL